MLEVAINTNSHADNAPTASTIKVFKRLAHFPGSTEETIPENMDIIIEKKGTFCTNAIYISSFLSFADISSRSRV